MVLSYNLIFYRDECRSKRKRKNRDVDEEAEFEQIPRKRAQPTDADNANMKPLLPIKSKRGGVIPQMVEMPEGNHVQSDRYLYSRGLFNIYNRREKTQNSRPY